MTEPPAGSGPAPRVDPPNISEVVARRIESGLAFDEDSVQRAIENSMRPDYPLTGWYYTPEEEAALGDVERP